jgi:hypothetical protein
VKDKPQLVHRAVWFGDEDDAPQVTLRAAGAAGALSREQREEMLARVAAGGLVSLELDFMPFRQREGERNRNAVRFRDGGLRALARSGKGMPLLRDHDQGNSLAVGGYITASSVEQVVVDGGAEWRLTQSARLTAPWMVELALRDLIRHFSIGWDPTGPILCTVCNEDYYRGCPHYRGQRLEDGTVVEVLYTDARLVETSIVPVPAVLGTEVESIRAALSAARDNGAAARPGENMNLLTRLLPLLSLAATAGETEVIAAVEAQGKENDRLRKELAVADADNKKLAARVSEFEGEIAQRAEDEFIAQALRSGRIDKVDEEIWRDLFKADAKRAGERMAARPAGKATPVGQPRQSDKPAPAESASGDDAEVASLFQANGVSYSAAKRFAAAFGAKDPAGALARHAAGKGA